VRPIRLAADYELLDDGQPVTIDRVRFLGASEYPAGTTLDTDRFRTAARSVRPGADRPAGRDGC
jgi:hypothetical protein